MHGDAEYERDQVKEDRQRVWYDTEPRQRHADHHSAKRGVDHAVEAELFSGNSKLAVDRQHQQRVEFSGADQFRNIGNVDEKKALENLGDHLVGADEKHHFPFRPITDVIYLPENNAEENNLSAEPKDLDDHPQQEVCLEAHFPNEGVAEHDRVDFDVTAH